MKQRFIQKYDFFFFIAILVMILFLVWSARAQDAFTEREGFYTNNAAVAIE